MSPLTAVCPVKKTDMPAPVNDDTYTISQRYRFVKGVKRENGGIKYSDKEKATLAPTCVHPETAIRAEHTQ